MRISVFGLGYVGSVSAACLASRGHEVVGVDVSEAKAAMLASGRSPVVEPGLAEMIAENAEAGRLSATTRADEAISQTELSLVCVGTPSQANGSLDLDNVARVCEEIGTAMRRKNTPHIVVIRSTILPGTMRDIVLPTLEGTSGMVAGRDFGLANNPEFLRESTAVADFHAPPKTVIGAIDRGTAETVATLYRGIDAPLVLTSMEVAEMVKYVDNSWHALKVAFGNEIGNICQRVGVDSHEVMEIFCRDTKLNISKAYLKPGFAFGGSCLPKDLRALVHRARSLDVDVPVLSSILPSNRIQVDRAVDRVMALGSRRVGVLGLSFKAGTDDLRESPLVELIERLIGKGFDVRVFDRNVNVARLSGANRRHMDETIPHLSSILAANEDEVIGHGDAIVVGNDDPAFHDAMARLRPGQTVVDLVRLKRVVPDGVVYQGINW
jgi:GDP-mannose 6-dehydrogenase